MSARSDRTIIVVAGGRGVRLGPGPPKALRSLAGRSLLERVVSRAGDWADTVLVSAPPGMDLPPLAGVRVVRDAAAFGPWAGPLVALASALEETPSEWTYALAVDLPLVRESLISLLWERRTSPATPLPGTPSHSAPLAVIPWSSRGPEPLCALYHRDAAPILMAFAREGERAITRAALALPLVQVTEEEVRAVDPEMESFLNMNTPEAWARVESMLGTGGGS